MDENTLSPRLQRLLAATVVLVIAGCVYMLVAAFITYRTTVVLHIDSSSSQATISVGQANHETKTIGTGKASVRLKPGTYQAWASDTHGQTVKTVMLSRQRSASVFLKLSDQPLIRSVNDIHFDGVSVFTDSGLTEDQLMALELGFFHFKPSAKTVVIDGNSLRLVSGNPRLGEPFTKTFNVTIDSNPYKASITYSGLNNLRLVLQNPQNGNVVFDSDTAGLPNQTQKAQE